MQTRRLILGVLAGTLCAPTLLRAQAARPLRTAVDANFPPHAAHRLDGTLEGFNIDLFREIARRMGREIVIETGNFSGLIPALNAGRYDFLAAPTTVTRERAERLLFTEGYLFTEYQFGIRRGAEPLRDLSELRGQVLAVNKGSSYDIWATENRDRVGYEMLVFDTYTDAVQAVVNGRARANLGGNTTQKYAAIRLRAFVPDLVLRETRAHWAAPFRQDNAELRDAMERVLECMKHDGTVASMSERWFGAKPAADDAENTVFPGFGVPGLPGYDPALHDLSCS